mmetsp:Transcript_66747/g.118086  ORF Transcript_66747/g.118086 Transcript_66747/m.118086 type:complete len:121 (+) Transcript_66747:46-408(+)
MLKVAVLLIPLVLGHYGKPPCKADEVELTIGGQGYLKGTVCAPSCKNGNSSSCPTDSPKKTTPDAPEFVCRKDWGTEACVILCDDTGPACPDDMMCSVRDGRGFMPEGPCIYDSQELLTV